MTNTSLIIRCHISKTFLPTYSGTRYIVVDCGGGTVDMTVHEMESKHGTLRELYKATGGPYGSVGE